MLPGPRDRRRCHPDRGGGSHQTSRCFRRPV